MNYFFKWLRSIRVSNLIFIFFLPFIIYFIAISRNYGKALKSILGIEENALSLLLAFIILALIGIFVFITSLKLYKSIRLDVEIKDRISSHRTACIFLSTSILLIILISNLPVLNPYIVSVAVNSFDPRTTDWIIMIDQSFVLEPSFENYIIEKIRSLILIYGLLLSLFLLYIIIFRQNIATSLGKLCILFNGLIGFLIAFYIIMIAHAGFSLGLAVTLRAAFFAYTLAGVLGLVWALLSKLKPNNSASLIYLLLGFVFISLGIYCFSKPYQNVALYGSLDGKIGIVSGTPQHISDQVRYGDFLTQKPNNPFKIRSIKTNEQAIKLLDSGKISAALIPPNLSKNYNNIWETNFLPTKDRNIGIFATILGVFLVLIVLIGRLTQMHPLAIFSDFFVDTIRGVPMLVIILYIGLPLAGAIKSASAGYIDMQMMTRGIIAIGIGYSAYMAEIFRAGIEAVPKGQIEAARTLGLKEIYIARLIILPQAIAIVLPALGNEFIAMLKDTSLVSILSVRDITQRMREFQAQSFLPFEPFNTAALLYILLTLLAASSIKSLEKIVNKNKENK